MPKQGDVHVVYAKTGKTWRVEVTGKARVREPYDKTAGCGAGTPAGEPKQVRARGPQPDGRIGERRSYGNDPFPPRG